MPFRLARSFDGCDARVAANPRVLRRAQQYNDLRENKFKEWKFNNKTWFPIVLMSAILPVACYKMTKAELVRRRCVHVGVARRGVV